MKHVNYCAALLAVLVFTPLAAREQHGPFVSMSYYPVSYALPGKVPYNEEPVGTVSNKPSDGNELSSFQAFKISGGYFYGLFMGQLTYDSASGSDFLPDQPDYPVDDTYDYTVTHFEATAGVRLSSYGDSSFTYVYAGYRRIDYSTDYLGIDMSGNGYVLGFTGFYSFGAAFDFEYVAYINGYFGNYPDSDYSADNVTGRDTHTQSVCAGGAIGSGVQYEPMNITILALASFEVDQISHNAKIVDGYADFGVRHIGTYFGIGVMYQHLNFKYNR